MTATVIVSTFIINPNLLYSSHLWPYDASFCPRARVVVMSQSKLHVILNAVVQGRLDHKGRRQDGLHPINERQVIYTLYLVSPIHSDRVLLMLLFCPGLDEMAPSKVCRRWRSWQVCRPHLSWRCVFNVAIEAICTASSYLPSLHESQSIPRHSLRSK